MLEARFCQVTKKSKWTLSHLRHRVLHALVQKLHDIWVYDKFLYVTIQTFCQAWQQIQGYYHEILVRSLKLLRILGICLYKKVSCKNLANVQKIDIKSNYNNTEYMPFHFSKNIFT